MQAAINHSALMKISSSVLSRDIILASECRDSHSNHLRSIRVLRFYCLVLIP